MLEDRGGNKAYMVGTHRATARYPKQPENPSAAIGFVVVCLGQSQCLRGMGGLQKPEAGGVSLATAQDFDALQNIWLTEPELSIR